MTLPSARSMRARAIAAPAGLAALVLAACGQAGDPAPDISVSDGWVRATPGGAAVTAAYFTLHNAGGADRLLAVSSDQVERVELHRGSTDANGVMRMEPVDAIAAPAGGAAVLAPGGDHLMLYGAAGLALGHTVCLTLRFERADAMLTCLPVMDAAPLR